MAIADEIRLKLEQAFRPDKLQVVDDSESHRGHGGWREGGETHFNIAIRAPAFAGMTRVERHRAVHAAIGRDLVSRIHALSLDISA